MKPAMSGFLLPVKPTVRGVTRLRRLTAVRSEVMEPTSLESALSGDIPVPITEDVLPGEPVKAEEAAPPAAKPDAPKEDKPKEEPWHVKAVAEERRKRQDAERRLAELEKAPEKKPNLFEDPDNWEKQLDERVEKRLAAVRQESESRFLVLVEQAALARHTDFKEMAEVFAVTAKSTPGLIEEARNAPDPAEFIYQAGKNLKRVQEAGSIEALIEKAREEGRQEALKGKSEPKIPESLTDTVGGKGDTGKSWSGPKPLVDLLPTY
jgi:hypothetical protein